MQPHQDSTSPLRLLITSVSSLVGQNILDALEFRPFPRRSAVELIGISSEARHPNNFRCDRFYHLPPIAEAEAFHARFGQILDREQPRLVLAGRDADALVLARLQLERPDLLSPYGSPATVQITLNKHASARFAAEAGLAFAASHLAGPGSEPAALAAFCEQVGYPLIAKPREGYASQGVYFVRDWQDACRLQAQGEWLFQEYLGQGRELADYLAAFAGVPPLFLHPRLVFHHSCQTYISRRGEVGEVFVSYNRHLMGQTVEFRRVEIPELTTLTLRSARALAAVGGRGPFNIQCRQDRSGAWKILEMNARTNGNTSARLCWGYDELGLILNDLLPGAGFPHLPPQPPASGTVLKLLHEGWVADAWADAALSEGAGSGPA